MVGDPIVDYGVYWKYLDELVQEALVNSDRTNKGISNYLQAKQNPGFLTRHRHEKTKALEEAIKAFNEHQHWPLEIVLSHLGIDKNSL